VCAQGILVFGEELTLFTVAGTLLIFTGVLLVAFRARANGSSSSNGSNASGKQAGGLDDSREDPAEAVPLKALDPQQQWQQQQQQHQHQQQEQSVALDRQQQEHQDTGVDPSTTVLQQQVEQGQGLEQQQQKGVLEVSIAMHSDAVSRDQQLGVQHTAAAAGAAQPHAAAAVADVELGLCPVSDTQSLGEPHQQQQQHMHSNQQQPLLVGQVYSSPAGALCSSMQ
jgi:hypothetical protein